MLQGSRLLKGDYPGDIPRLLRTIRQCVSCVHPLQYVLFFATLPLSFPPSGSIYLSPFTYIHQLTYSIPIDYETTQFKNDLLEFIRLDFALP